MDGIRNLLRYGINAKHCMEASRREMPLRRLDAPSAIPYTLKRDAIPSLRLGCNQNERKSSPLGLPFVLVAGVGFEPHDLRVMSPTSYQAALPRDMVPEAGIEPVRDCSHGILSPGRLPIPPFRHVLRLRCFLIIAPHGAFVNPFGKISDARRLPLLFY